MVGWENDPIVEARWEGDPIVSGPSGRKATRLALGPGAAVPPSLQAAAGPHSAGKYPIGRRYSVQDRVTYDEFDGYTGAKRRTYGYVVTKVDEDADRVEINDGAELWDTLGNTVKTQRSDFFDTPRQFTPAELFVGKKWTAVFRVSGDGSVRRVSFELRIRARERIVVPAGQFNAFRVEGEGSVVEVESGQTGVTSFEDKWWLLPGVNFFVKHERITRSQAPYSAVIAWRRRELVSLSQASFLAPDV